MLTEKYFGNFHIEPSDSGNVPAADYIEETDSSVIFEEQQVTTAISDKTWPTGVINCSQENHPETLIIDFEDQEYTLQGRESYGKYLYGCSVKAGGVPMFSDELPFLVTCDGTAWTLSTAHEGTYTISARLPDPEPEPTPEPKRKSRSSIISQLTRLVKALGGNARKSSRTIASQLSALADLAEAGGIGGGGVMFVNAVSANNTKTLDKTWKEIKDASDTAIIVIHETTIDGVLHYDDYTFVISIYNSQYRQYSVDDGNLRYVTNTENGYPVAKL